MRIPPAQHRPFLCPPSRRSRRTPKITPQRSHPLGSRCANDLRLRDHFEDPTGVRFLYDARRT